MSKKINYRGMSIVIILAALLCASSILFVIPSNFTYNSDFTVSDPLNNVLPVKVQDDPGFDAIIENSFMSGSDLVVEFYHNSENLQPISVIGLDSGDYMLSRAASSGGEIIKLKIPGWNDRYFKLKVGSDSEVFEFGIRILNVQSYPAVGGNWTVMFNTTGKADLWISAVNGTEFGEDLELIEVRCGNSPVNFEFINNFVFIKDYECDETGVEISKVLTCGKHHLEFKFGDEAGYAANYAPVLSSLIIPENIILITMNDEYNENLLYSLLPIEKNR